MRYTDEQLAIALWDQHKIQMGDLYKAKILRILGDDVVVWFRGRECLYDVLDWKTLFDEPPAATMTQSQEDKKAWAEDFDQWQWKLIKKRNWYRAKARREEAEKARKKEWRRKVKEAWIESDRHKRTERAKVYYDIGMPWLRYAWEAALHNRELKHEKPEIASHKRYDQWGDDYRNLIRGTSAVCPECGVRGGHREFCSKTFNDNRGIEGAWYFIGSRGGGTKKSGWWGHEDMNFEASCVSLGMGTKMLPSRRWGTKIEDYRASMP